MIKANAILMMCMAVVIWSTLETKNATSEGARLETDDALLSQMIFTFCGSQGQIFSVCPSGETTMSYAIDTTMIKQERLAACRRMLEEAGKRNISATISFGNRTQQFDFNKTTLDDLLKLA